MKMMKTKILLFAIVIVMAGCTVRGGWPRFLRWGEAPGWSGPKPDKITTNQNAHVDE